MIVPLKRIKYLKFFSRAIIMSLDQSLLLDDNKFTFDYFLQENVCRLCWQISKNATSLENDSTLKKKIHDCIGVNVTSEIPEIPCKICYICLEKIDSFINFKMFCLQADKKLKIILATDPTQQEFENNYINEKVLKKEVELELNLLANELKKEKLEDLTISEDKELMSSELEDCELDGDLFPDDDYYCYICDTNFDSIGSKLKHNIQCHIVKENISYACFTCKKTFKNFSLKISHEMRCKSFKKKCNTCFGNSRRDESVDAHLKLYKKLQKEIKETAFKCRTCSKMFHTQEELQEHRLIHIKDSRCVCEVCGRTVKRTTMVQHIKIHTNPRELKCTQCDYRATHQCTLDMHMRTHTGERPFACDICPYRCVNSSNLRKHQKTHLGIKDFTCHICHNKYGYKDSLLEHIASVHEGIRKHKCKRCGIQYFRFKDLRRHMLVKHGKGVKKMLDDFIEIDVESLKKKKMGKKFVKLNSGRLMVIGSNCEEKNKELDALP